MRNIITSYLEKLGFVTKEKGFKELKRDFHVDTCGYTKSILELKVLVNEYDLAFKDCIQVVHKIKKLEEYLNVMYVSEQTDKEKAFIGYVKKYENNNSK